jgi:hypothetical protein
MPLCRLHPTHRLAMRKAAAHRTAVARFAMFPVRPQQLVETQAFLLLSFRLFRYRP